MTASTDRPTQLSPRIAALLGRIQASRGGVVFALDATASREPTWDMAAQLQASMFEEAARIGGLDVQLVYYCGSDEVRHTSWFADAHELARRMRTIRCDAGATQIKRVLRHIRTEHEREKVSAAVFIGDACEEPPDELYAAAAGLGAPVFMFQEGDGEVMYLNERGEVASDGKKVEQVFRELARLTGGAYGKFNSGAAKQLAELLRAVAAFAVGGLKALANQHTGAAQKLLSQLK
jgi:hypothetical protein